MPLPNNPFSKVADRIRDVESRSGPSAISQNPPAADGVRAGVVNTDLGAAVEVSLLDIDPLGDGSGADFILGGVASNVAGLPGCGGDWRVLATSVFLEAGTPAVDDGDFVGFLRDQAFVSPLFQANEATRPTLETEVHAGLPALAFRSAGDRLEVEGVDLSGDWTVAFWLVDAGEGSEGLSVSWEDDSLWVSWWGGDAPADRSAVWWASGQAGYLSADAPLSPVVSAWAVEPGAAVCVVVTHAAGPDRTLFYLQGRRRPADDGDPAGPGSGFQSDYLQELAVFPRVLTREEREYCFAHARTVYPAGFSIS